MSIQYRKFKTNDSEILKKMIQNLYREDAGGNDINEDKINKTIQTLSNHPEKGSILIMEKEGAVIGYCILIHFWSNEYGGDIINIDELYIQKEYRNQGIGSHFMKHIIKTKPQKAVAIDLETTPKNKKARELYKKLGFRPWENIPMRYEFN